MNKYIIECENVTKEIKKQCVINNIDLKLSAGRIIGFKGINGAGKTMLMRLIAGLIRPTTGHITICGKRLGRDITFPESIGILLEAPAFLDAYSGFQNLRMLASIKGKINDETIKKTIQLVGLDPSSKKKYKKYSLGMKQRLGIAAAIMESPDIVILDEPTNSLDSDGVEIVKKIIKQEKERGALVIISCHDINILKNMSDEIYILDKGRITNHIVTADKGEWVSL